MFVGTWLVRLDGCEVPCPRMVGRGAGVWLASARADAIELFFRPRISSHISHFFLPQIVAASQRLRGPYLTMNNATRQLSAHGSAQSNLSTLSAKPNVHVTCSTNT